LEGIISLTKFKNKLKAARFYKSRFCFAVTDGGGLNCRQARPAVACQSAARKEETFLTNGLLKHDRLSKPITCPPRNEAAQP
jgi:hypothetical protein